MKQKNTGLIQKHLEKAVLAVGVLFLLVVVGISFVGNPFAVQVENRTMSPREVESHLQSLAARLDANLRSDDALERTIAQRDIPPYRVEFAERRSQPLASEPRYGWPIGQPGLATTMFRAAEEPDPYHVPRPPMPRNVTARAGYGVLGQAPESAVQRELVSFVDNPQTGDFRYVTVDATFNMAEFIERLQQNPPSGYQRVPEGFWMTMRSISGVYLQREEYDPQTGEWGNRRIIEPLPTQIAFGHGDEQTRSSWGLAEARDRVAEIRRFEAQIAQPEFVPLAAPSFWVPPTQASRPLTAAQQRRVGELNEQIRALQERLDRNIRTIESRTGRTQSSGTRQGGTGFRPDFDVQDDRPRGGGAAAAGDPLMELIQRDREAIAVRQRERAEIYGIQPTEQQRRQQHRGQMPPYMDPDDLFLEEEYDVDPGMMFDQNRSQLGQPQQPRQTGRRARLQQQQQPGDAGDEQEWTVWAHDLTVEPGRMYRYRVLVTVLNPLFQRRGLPDSQQEEYFNRLVLWPDETEVAATDWSNTVRVDPEHYFFLVDGQPNLQEATVEVWRLYRGAWRVNEFQARPGDLLGGTATLDDQQTVPMRVDSVLVDLVPVAEGSSRDARMIYLDRSTNRIHQRTAEEDRNSDDRIRLRNEFQRSTELADRTAFR